MADGSRPAKRWFTFETVAFAWDWVAMWLYATSTEYHAHMARHELLEDLAQRIAGPAQIEE